MFEVLGNDLYEVGGCVRDFLLNLEIKDIDYSTSKKPQELLQTLPGATLVSAAQAYPVVLYKGFEIASFRSDKARQDLGAMQLGVSIEEDAARRDFTINALYRQVSTGDILDPTGQGLQDLENKLIRFVGDPYARIEEDPVRMLRALRFKISLPGFSFETATEKALRKLFPVLRIK